MTSFRPSSVRISRVSPGSAARVLAALMGVSGLAGALFIGIGGSLMAGEDGLPGASALMLVLLPILYTVMGGVSGALWAALYNFSATLVGPLEIELEG